MSYPARQIDTTKPYKLRIYVKSGIHKGDLKRQEYFSNLNDLDKKGAKQMKYSPREIRSLSDKKRHAIIGDIAREVRNKRSTIKTLHKVHPLNMTEEEVQLKIQDLTTQIAKADHYRLQLLYPGIEAIYEDRIVEICGKSSIKEMVSNGLIESCAMINGRKLYAL